MSIHIHTTIAARINAYGCFLHSSAMIVIIKVYLPKEIQWLRKNIYHLFKQCQKLWSHSPLTGSNHFFLALPDLYCALEKDNKIRKIKEVRSQVFLLRCHSKNDTATTKLKSLLRPKLFFYHTMFLLCYLLKKFFKESIKSMA